MKYSPIKCWILKSHIIDQEIETQRDPDFQLIKKSILKRGFRGFLINDRPEIENKEWYRDFLLGVEVMVYLDGSGVYRIANIDLSENEIYLDRLNIPVGYRPWIFYSWQSDYPEVRAEIQEVLKDIIEDVNRTRAPRQELKLENVYDTARGGADDIVTTLKRSIDQSLIFVADITNVAKVRLPDGTEQDKWHPNSNVIFEMSYAFIKKTEDQVILLKKLGETEKTRQSPFDIAQHRTLFYRDREELKTRLGTALQSSLEKIGYIVKLNST